MSRKNISISTAVKARADALIALRGFDGLSDCVATLIREEYERRQPPIFPVESPREALAASVKAEETALKPSPTIEALVDEIQDHASADIRQKRQVPLPVASVAPPAPPARKRKGQ